MAARLCGVNVRHVYALTFAVSAAFAGAAGIVIGIILPFSPADEATWTLNAFVVVVLGGVGSPGRRADRRAAARHREHPHGAIYRPVLSQRDDVPAAGAPAAGPPERPARQRLRALAMKPQSRAGRRCWSALAAVVLALAPLVLPPFYVRVGQLMLYSAGLGVAWTILGGFAGYASFGHAAFIGVGAFAAGLVEGQLLRPAAVLAARRSACWSAAPAAPSWRR